MRELFRNASPGALTRAQAVALEKERVRREKMAAQLARQGRGEDTEIAHVARGELVIPEALQSREVMAAVRRAAVESGIPLEQLRVGNRGNSINPETGLAEFGLLATVDEVDARVRGNGASLPDLDAQGLTPQMRETIAQTERSSIPYNPIENYPVPGSTSVTQRRGETGQGSGEFLPRAGDRPHRGVDFEVPGGQPILAMGDGTVVSATPLPGFGNQIAIRHANGITSQVAHVGSMNVKAGAKVKAGDIIGISGDGRDPTAAGNAHNLDPQVHVEIRGGNGLPAKNGGTIYNPWDYLPPRK